ncbi:hypothetical protein [Actinoallomurus iriomotensis]|uniref:Uncharacterized protein n=1 Tax=Actinoallomurus iriomotensis TaxID=478107 RepID=A0A9W6VYY4_9ACTN|nr:hypothetical protein [Actinoallomurus iriomotensis]GLY83301.1 hypothetical protein Airi02_012310 [Actinoallomurus iriomotensis]
MRLHRLVPLSLTAACAVVMASAVPAVASPAATTATQPALTSDRGLPPEYERALFASTYASLRDRVSERGYAPTSLKGYYGGMYTRDASVNALALILGRDYPQARGILRYILGYTAASGQPTIPHRIFPLSDTLAPDGQQTQIGHAVVGLGGGREFTQSMPAPGIVTAVDAWLSRSTAAHGMVTATLRAVQDSRSVVVDKATLPVSELPANGGWVTFRFAPPLLTGVPSGGYTLSLSGTGPSGGVTWWGDAKAGAAFREYTHDFALSGYDAWDEVDEKYSVLLAWARYVRANRSDRAFVAQTWPLVRKYADYHLNQPGYLSDELNLIRNPILDDEGYNNVYDLLTNTVTAQALHELVPLAKQLGAADDAHRWAQTADRISRGIRQNLITNVDGKPVYGAWYDGKDPAKFTAGWTFVNLSPIAFSWYGLDRTIMRNTVAAYMAHESRDWSGVRMLSSMSDYAFTGHNDWVLTKGLAWEWAQAHQAGDTARIGQLDQFLRHYYPDVTQPISEGWILDSDGSLRVTDPGNQEHAGWFAVMLLENYPALRGHH